MISGFGVGIKYNISIENDVISKPEYDSITVSNPRKDVNMTYIHAPTLAPSTILSYNFRKPKVLTKRTS
jgi:hypothetical protein